MSTFWLGRRVLLTGHTGFKGTWLAIWLESMGAEVHGLALPPATQPNLHDLTGAWDDRRYRIVDIRDSAAVRAVVAGVQPEIVFHLAAQALVRPAYRDPIDTFATNVMGTLHVLDAIRACSSVSAAVIVTTDKVYENLERGHPFGEGDRLGGKDPYSNSKACAELATQCYRDSFFAATGRPNLATARAGNVVGGGDWSADRLIPDVIRAHASGQKVSVRYPGSVRPWQHVLEPLSGYLDLARKLIEAPRSAPLAVNFGPAPESFLTVAQVLDMAGLMLAGPEGKGGWEQAPGVHPPEAKALTLASDLARETLGWRPRLTMQETMAWTIDWYHKVAGGMDARALTLQQIGDYEQRLATA